VFVTQLSHDISVNLLAGVDLENMEDLATSSSSRLGSTQRSALAPHSAFTQQSVNLLPEVNLETLASPAASSSSRSTSTRHSASLFDSIDRGTIADSAASSLPRSNSTQHLASLLAGVDRGTTSTATKPNTDLEDTDAFDPDNDVRLVMRDDQTMLVSSQILAAHSKVFAVMFNGCFSESTRLAANSKAFSITEIDLPDDDPEAMSMLYEILQIESSNDLTPDNCAKREHEIWTSPAPNYNKIFKLVVLADKYDCRQSIFWRFDVWSDLMLNRRRSPHERDETARDRLAIGYLARVPWIFNRACVDLMKFANGPFESLLMEQEIYADILPACLPGEFRGQCTVSWKRSSDSIIQAVLEVKRKFVREKYTEFIRAAFTSQPELTSLYVKLSNWMRDVDSARTSLTTLSDILLRHEYADDVSKKELLAHMHDKTMYLKGGGLCFICVKNQAFDAEVMNCSHGYDWGIIGYELFEPLGRSSGWQGQ